MTSRTLNNLTISILDNDIVKNKYDTNTLSHRLNLCLRLYSMSQSELARLIDVKPQIIQYLCTKNVKSSRFTFELAEALGVDYTWLSTGEGNMQQPVDAILEQHKIPLFAWDKLDQILNRDNFNNHYGEFVYTSIASNFRLVATRIDDTSMEPRFEKGTIIIINLDEDYNQGDFILVKLNQSSKWVFRQCHIRKNIIELIPINNGLFKNLVLEPENKIAGVLVQTICNFKRERD